MRKMKLMVCLTVMAISCQLFAGTVTISNPTDDAYIDRAGPDGTYGAYGANAPYLKTMAGGTSTTNSRKSYLRFDTSSITEEVTAVDLSLVINDFNHLYGNWQEVLVYGLKDGAAETAWTDNGITWNNATANNTSDNYFYLSDDVVCLGSFSIAYNAEKTEPLIGIGGVATFSGGGYNVESGSAVDVDPSVFVDFFNADTNGQVTIMLSSRYGTLDTVSFAANEDETYDPAKLVVTTVPEPVTMMLLGLGGVSVFIRRRV